MHSVPRPKVRRAVKQLLGNSGALVQQPLDEVQHVRAGAKQRHDAGELVTEVLCVQFRAERADADVERRAALVVNDVDVAAGRDQQVEDVDELPVGGDVYRGLARLVRSGTWLKGECKEVEDSMTVKDDGKE